MSIEIWKDIENYEGFYQVSNEGRVRSLDRIIKNRTKNGGHRLDRVKGKMLACSPCNIGYPRVSLCKNGDSNKIHVHRLVAASFLSNTFNLPNVNHKDANKLNNNIDNLEWVTQARNVEHGFDLNLNHHGIKHHAAKLTEEDVRMIRRRYETEDISQRKLAKEVGISFTTVRMIVIGKRWRRLSN